MSVPSQLCVLALLVSTGSLTHKSRRYLDLCPTQNRSLPCDPTNLDGFMSSNLKSMQDIKTILSKAYIPGGCYHLTDKYCPHTLSSCLSSQNMGYSWTVQGVCLHKSVHCPRLTVEEKCGDMQCSPERYLCHPKGCIPLISHCNGACPNLPSFSQKENLLNYSKSSSLYLNEQTSSSSQFVKKFQRRILCGNSCLTKEEARNKYDCGGVCQVKSEPCRAKDENICPQHFSRCGEDICIDRFLQDKAIAATGHPEFYSCSDICTHHSLPCFSPSNQSLACQTGYWLCEDQTQCVLQGLDVRGTFFSNLCDGQMQCKDGSDESFYECLQVYSYEATLTTILLVVVLPFLLSLLYCYRAGFVSIFTGPVDVQGKSYHRNEGFSDYLPSSPSSCLTTPCHTPPAPPPPSPANISITSPSSFQPENIPLIPSAPPLPPPLPPPPPQPITPAPTLQLPYPRFVFTTHPPESYQPLESTALKF